MKTTRFPGGTTIAIEGCLKRLKLGDETAIDDLTAHSYERVRLITHRQLRQYPGLTRFVETHDVLHDVLSKLNAKMPSKSPSDAREYFRWASRQIRDHLIDLLRHFYGRASDSADTPARARPSASASLDSLGRDGYDPASDTYDAAKIQEMAEFHEAVGQLPADLREVFDLLFYHGLTQDQAANVIGVTDRTIRTRWQRARRQLAGFMPFDLAEEPE